MNEKSVSPQDGEALIILAEECAEVIKCVTKILRHGYRPTHSNIRYDNVSDLEAELGDVRAAMIRACSLGIVNLDAIHDRVLAKREQIKPYLHYPD